MRIFRSLYNINMLVYLIIVLRHVIVHIPKELLSRTFLCIRLYFDNAQFNINILQICIHPSNQKSKLSICGLTFSSYNVMFEAGFLMTS